MRMVSDIPNDLGAVGNPGGFMEGGYQVVELVDGHGVGMGWGWESGKGQLGAGICRQL